MPGFMARGYLGVYLAVCTPEGLRPETALCSACAPHQTALHSQLLMFVGVEILMVCFAARGRLSALNAWARRAWTAWHGQIVAASSVG